MRLILGTRLQPARPDQILLDHRFRHRANAVVERWPPEQHRFEAKIARDGQVKAAAQLKLV